MGDSISHGCCSTTVRLPTQRTSLAGLHCTWWPKVNITVSKIASTSHNYYWTTVRMPTRKTRTTQLHCTWHPTMGELGSHGCCSTTVRLPTRRTTKTELRCTQWLRADLTTP